MRFIILAFLLLPVPSISQAIPDSTGAAEALNVFLTTANTEGVSGTANLIACPIEAGEERPVAGLCDTTLAAHRVRVERITDLARTLFPSESAALNPNYGVEEERGGVFHLLLFSDLEMADYVMATFMDVAGAYRLTDLDMEGGPETIPPPRSVVDSFERLIDIASDEASTLEPLAPFVVARGDDEEREWKAPADLSRPNERGFVEHAHQIIGQLLFRSGGEYEIEGYESDGESEGEWHVLFVRFGTGEMEEHVWFGFLPIGEHLLLGDIDR